ncbi:MAG: hypothetical protein HQ446_02025 [Polaromonas sp.]|nr:hypothetical protein [Polaromonas sp.]
MGGTAAGGAGAATATGTAFAGIGMMLKGVNSISNLSGGWRLPKFWIGQHSQWATAGHFKLPRNTVQPTHGLGFKPDNLS